MRLTPPAVNIADFEALLSSPEELDRQFRSERLTGNQAASVLKRSADFLKLSPVQKRIASTILNFCHPHKSGVCFASVETIARAAETSVATVERFFRGIGAQMFDSQRRFKKTTLRTLTANMKRFLLGGRYIQRCSYSEELTKSLFAELVQSFFGAIKLKRRGRPSVDKKINCEGNGGINCDKQKELQDLELQKIKIKPKEPVFGGLKNKQSNPFGLLIGRLLAAATEKFNKTRQLARWKTGKDANLAKLASKAHRTASQPVPQITTPEIPINRSRPKVVNDLLDKHFANRAKQPPAIVPVQSETTGYGAARILKMRENARNRTPKKR